MAVVGQCFHSVLLLTGWPGVVGSCLVDTCAAKSRKGLPHPYATLVVVAAPDTLVGIAITGAVTGGPPFQVVRPIASTLIEFVT